MKTTDGREATHIQQENEEREEEEEEKKKKISKIFFW